MRLLRLLYPPSWRRRYGDEFDALLADSARGGRSRLRFTLDVLRGAADAWLHPRAAAGRTPANSAALRRGVAIALPAAAAVATVIAVTRNTDDTVTVAACYLGVMVVLFVVGRAAAPVAASGAGPRNAGMIAGVIIGVLATAAFFAVQNLDFATVGARPSNVTGLARSGLHSMRLYVNLSLVLSGTVLTAFLAGCGAALGMAGAASSRRPGPDRRIDPGRPTG